jgi:peptide/nickel transport system ATP-binding protein
MLSEPLLALRALSKRFHSEGRIVTALDGIDLDVHTGETVALVGGSGSGKSTLARIVLRLLAADSGSITFNGEDMLSLNGSALRKRRRHIQMVFQDPLAAFNPRATVARILSDPLRIHGLAGRSERRARVEEMLVSVDLSPSLAERHIHQISGGQRQRVAIARALATGPKLVVLDEALSALDVSVRGEIVALLLETQRRTGVAYLFIAHDLALVRATAARTAVMDAGRIVEIGPTLEVLANPQDDRTRALIAAAPRLRSDPHRA